MAALILAEETVTGALSLDRLAELPGEEVIRELIKMVTVRLGDRAHVLGGRAAHAMRVELGAPVS